jgi:hypothetical protein
MDSLHSMQMGEAVRHKRSWVRKYTPRSDEEEIEEIRQRIAVNRAAAARQETKSEEQEAQDKVPRIDCGEF